MIIFLNSKTLIATGRTTSRRNFFESYVAGDHPVRYSEERAACADQTLLRIPLFGDLHVHTALSFDAVAGRINIMREDAYNYARGKPIAFFPQGEQGEPTGIT